MVRQFSSPILAVSLLAGALVLVGALPRATAQCETQWLPGPTFGGTDASVHASCWWDPDGAGPLQPVLAVGGRFRTAGPVAATSIALFDPVSGAWSALGAGVASTAPTPTPLSFRGVAAMTTLPNGDLVVGGTFTTAGGVAANNVARWNGSSWSALGSGTDADVKALATLPNGDVVAAGYFATAGGVVVNRVARWNGSAWSPLGSGLGSQPGNSHYAASLTALPNGDVVVGGHFSLAGGTGADNIARWNGSAWSALGAGVSDVTGNATVVSLVTMPNGDVVASGDFDTAGGAGANGIARWNGASWSALGPGLSSWASTLSLLPNGDLVAGGTFTTAGAASANRVAIWNGAVWSPLGSGMNGEVRALVVLPNADVLAFGQFTTAGGVAVEAVARWNGSSWAQVLPLSTCTNGGVYSLLPLPSGDVIVGGWFTSAGGTSANYIARWDGVNWSPLGTGMDGVVRALALLPNGDVVAGGDFLTAGGVAANFIARWNGTAWSPLASGMADPVRALATLPDGTLVAGGLFWVMGGIMSWDGASWVPLGPPTFLGVEAILSLPNGDLVAGGYAGLNSSVASWSGSNWLPLGPGTGSQVYALTGLPSGDVVAGGFGHVKQWNGTTWSPIAASVFGGNSGGVRALCTLPNGDVLAGGDFTNIGGVNADCIARWNGASWSPVGSGMTGPFFREVRALTALPGGDMLAGGEFTVAGGVPSAYVARLTTPCPALSSAYGAGCAGSGGNNVLTVTAPPWLGSTFRALATGMPASGFAAVVSGFAPISIALPAIFPQGVPGCTVLVSPDFVEIVLPVAGTVQTQLVLPDTVGLAGIVFHQQVVPFDVNASFVLTAVTSTNALSLMLGSF